MAAFDPTMSEAWYPIPNAPGYQISSHFRVRSFWAIGCRRVCSAIPQRMIALFKAKGYLAFSVRVDKRRARLYVHIVVAEIAHGPRPSGLWVLHKDDVTTNNDPSNLYYGTPLQNGSDSRRNGGSARGDRNGQAKLSEPEIMAIRRSHTEGVTQAELARRYGVTPSLIWRIVTRRVWSHV